MNVEYDRVQRESIYHPATIGDIPFEIVQKALRLVGRADLVSASSSCRAWRQAAVEVIIGEKRFDNERNIERFVCGMKLKSIVFGFEQYSIKNLYLDMYRIGIDHVRVMAQIVAPILSILCLNFQEPTEEEDEESDLNCYEVVEAFFSSCLQINYLRLEWFDFGDDPSSLTPSIKDGFGRLKAFNMTYCRGNLMMFAELAPIQNLSNLSFDSLGAIDAAEESGIISSIAMKSRSLKSISLIAQFETWETIHKVVECCRDLEEITIGDYSNQKPLNNPEFLAIASLPRLKSLDLVNCLIDDGDVSHLAKCKGLRHLGGANLELSSDLLREIGGNLATLRFKLGSRGLEEIVEFCPNLEILEITIKDEEGNFVNDEARRMSAAGLIKNGLKKLTKLKINHWKMQLRI
jgi:hypothetical protein